MAAGIPARLTPAEGRKFAFPVGIAFAVLAGISLWRGHTITPRVLGGLAGALLVAGALIPSYLGPVQRGWMAFAHALSKITTPIFMGAVYFVVLTPLALLMRLTGRQPMRHKEENGGFWADPPSGGRSDMEHQF